MTPEADINTAAAKASKNLEEAISQGAANVSDALESALTIAEIKEYISIAIICGKAFVVLFVLYKLFYNTRLRFFFTRFKIPLDKHNQIYCKNISTFFARYFYIENNQLNYKIDGFKDKFYQIQSILSDNLNNTRILEEDKDDGKDKDKKKMKNNLYSKSKDKNILEIFKDNKIIYNNDVEKFKMKLMPFVNKGFLASDLEKAGNTIDSDAFQYLMKKSFSTKFYANFNKYLDENFIFDFIDFDHMELESINENHLIQSYAVYLKDPTFIDIFEEISKQHEKSKITEENTFIMPQNLLTTRDADEDIEKLVKSIFDTLRWSMCDKCDVEPSLVDEKFNEKTDVKNVPKETCPSDSKKPKKKNKDVKSFDDYDEYKQEQVKEELSKQAKIRISIEDSIKNKKYDPLYTDIYFDLEEYVYTAKYDGLNNTCSTFTIGDVLNKYNKVLDLLYFQDPKYKDDILFSMKFTLNYMFDLDNKKKEKLDALVTYHSLTYDIIMSEMFHRDRLVAYNIARKPQKKRLEKLYIQKLKDITKITLYDGVVSPVYDYIQGKPPRAFEFYVCWIRDFLDFKKLRVLLFDEYDEKAMRDEQASINEPSMEQFTNIFDKSQLGGEVVEDFFGGGNPLDVFSGVGNFFKDVGNFFKSCFELFKVIGRFFKNIITFLSTMIKLIFKLFKLISRPIEFIEFAIKLVILAYLGAIGLFYNLGKKRDYRLMVLGEWFIYYNMIIYSYCKFAFLWVLYTLITVLGGLVIDVQIFRGRLYTLWYSFFAACENSPQAWYEYSSYHYGNRNERLFWAYYKCDENYYPDKKTGRVLCKKLSTSEPKYCPQANIYRLYDGLKPKTPYFPKNFNFDLDYIQAKDTKRRDMITDHKLMKQSFYDNCNHVMQTYDPIIKNICRTSDIANNNNTKDLNDLCYNTYCSNGKREVFCHKYTLPVYDISNSNSSLIGERICSIYIFICALSIVIELIITNNIDFETKD